MKKLQFAILKNELADDHQLWEMVCQERADVIDWEVIDLTRADWLEKATRKPFDGLLAKPPAYTMPFKTLYDERLTILHTVCNIPIYPSLEEIQVYENKKYLAYWLAANQIPHPKTHVFYYQTEAIDFLQNSVFPIVGKTNIGASGRGVTILKTKTEADAYVRATFGGKGAGRSTGPNWRKKGFVGRVIRKMLRPQVYPIRKIG